MKRVIQSLFLVLSIVLFTGCGSSTDDILTDTTLTTLSGYLYGTDNMIAAPSRAMALDANLIESITFEFAGITKEVVLDTETGFFEVSIEPEDVLTSTTFVSLLGTDINSLMDSMDLEDIANKYSVKLAVKIKNQVNKANIVLPCSLLKSQKTTVLPRVLIEEVSAGNFGFKIQDKTGMDLISDGGDFIESLTSTNATKVISVLSRVRNIDDQVLCDGKLSKNQIRNRIHTGIENVEVADLSGKLYVNVVNEQNVYMYSFGEGTYEIKHYEDDGTWSCAVTSGTYEVSDANLLFGDNDYMAYKAGSGLLLKKTNNLSIEMTLVEIPSVSTDDLAGDSIFAPGYVIQGNGTLFKFMDSDDADNLTDSFAYADYLGTISLDDDGKSAHAMIGTVVDKQIFCIGNKDIDIVNILVVENQNGSLKNVFFDSMKKITTVAIESSAIEGKTFFGKTPFEGKNYVFEFSADVNANDATCKNLNRYSYDGTTGTYEVDLPYKLTSEYIKIDTNGYLTADFDEADSTLREGSVIELEYSNLITGTPQKMYLREITDWVEADYKDKIFKVTDKDEIVYIDLLNEKRYVPGKDPSEYVMLDLHNVLYQGDKIVVYYSENYSSEFYRLISDDNKIVAGELFKGEFFYHVNFVTFEEVTSDDLPEIPVEDNSGTEG